MERQRPLTWRSPCRWESVRFEIQAKVLHCSFVWGNDIFCLLPVIAAVQKINCSIKLLHTQWYPNLCAPVPYMSPWIRTWTLRSSPQPRGVLAGLDYPLPSGSGGDLRVPGLGMPRTPSASKRQLSHIAHDRGISKGGDWNTPPGDDAWRTVAVCLESAAPASRMTRALQSWYAPATAAGRTGRSGASPAAGVDRRSAFNW